jgi:hypothetical protein
MIETIIDKIENLHPFAQFTAIIMLGLVIIIFIISFLSFLEDIFKSK